MNEDEQRELVELLTLMAERIAALEASVATIIERLDEGTFVA